MNGHESAPRNHNVWWQILLLFVLVLPLLLLLMAPRLRSSNELMIVFTLILIANLFLLWLATRRREVAANAVPPIIPRQLAPEEIPASIHEVLDVRDAILEDDVMVFRGALRENSEAAFERLKQEYAGRAVPLLQQDRTYGTAIYLMPQEEVPVVAERPVRWWLHWTLFFATLLTTTAVGAALQGGDALKDPKSLIYGLPYSLALMAILGFHELGHYFTAKHYGIRVTPPFFIPVPFALGTFGAFIQMRSAPEDRRSLFDVAVAGPFAGLVLAIPALIVGLKYSTIVPADAPGNDIGLGFIGSSILFLTIAKFAVGAQVFSNNILISPLAFAGMLGLLVTALNLLPIGQLDGGHIARGMFGTRVGGWISQVFMFCLFIAAFINPQYLFWALIVFFIARRVAPPMNDLTPIGPARMWLGALAFLILVLILCPMPESLWNAMNPHPEPQPETLTL
jgi:membrane-associated protease RseP (regulator of RpoE activity)